MCSADKIIEFPADDGLPAALFSALFEWSAGRPERAVLIASRETYPAVTLLCAEIAGMEAKKTIAAPTEAAGEFDRFRSKMAIVEFNPESCDWAAILLAGDLAVSVQASRGNGLTGPWELHVGKELVSKLSVAGLAMPDRALHLSEPTAEQKLEVLAITAEKAFASRLSVRHETELFTTVCQAWLGRIIRDLIHEFNNNLNGMLGPVEMAAELSGKAEVKGYLETALKSIRRLTTTLRALMEITRGRPSERELLMPRQLVETSLNMLQCRLRRKHMKIERSVGETGLLSANAAQIILLLIKIIENLWSEAQDGDRLSISIAPSSPPKWVTFSLELISSSGGLSPADIREQAYAHPPLFSVPVYLEDLERNCMLDIARRNTGRLEGPLTSESGIAYRLMLPEADTT